MKNIQQYAQALRNLDETTREVLVNNPDKLRRYFRCLAVVMDPTIDAKDRLTGDELDTLCDLTTWQSTPDHFETLLQNSINHLTDADSMVDESLYKLLVERQYPRTIDRTDLGYTISIDNDRIELMSTLTGEVMIINIS